MNKHKITLLIKCLKCLKKYSITLKYGKTGINECKKCGSSDIIDITPKDQLPIYLLEQLNGCRVSKL